MKLKYILNEKQYITDEVYFEQDRNKIYVVYTKTGKQDTFSKKHYYIYGGASKSLQIYAVGPQHKMVAEYANSGWNTSKHAKDMKEARKLSKKELDSIAKYR